GYNPEAQGADVNGLGTDAVLQKAECQGARGRCNLHDDEHEVANAFIPADDLGAINEGEGNDDVNPRHGEQYGNQEYRQIPKLAQFQPGGPDPFHAHGEI